MDRDEMSNLYRGPSIDASYQVLVNQAERFHRRRILKISQDFFRNQPIRNNNRLWRPCFLTHPDEMSILYRGLPKNASYQVSVHLAKRFQRRRYKKISQSETRIAVVAMFVNGSGRNEQTLQRTFHSPSYQVSVHLAQGFQRIRLKCEKLTDGRRWIVMTKAHTAFDKVS